MKSSMGLVAIAAVMVLAACSGGNTSVSTQVTSAKAALGTSTSTSLDRVRVVVRTVELRTQSGGTEEVKAGPFLLDLSGVALGGSVTQQFSADVPAGTYAGLEMKIQKLSDGESATGGLADMKALNASVAIDGTFNGKAFSFVSGVDADEDLPGQFQIASGTNNVTLTIDPSGWFVASDGTTQLDPGDPNNRSIIEQNIKASLTALEDDNENGEDDHQEHSGDADGGESGGNDAGGGR